MNAWKAFGCLFLLPLILQAQTGRKILVFSAGEGGYHTFRIPAIIRFGGQTLLAFCEARKSSSADFGDVDIVMKSSRDGGQTWSPLKRLVDAGFLQAGNPAPVVDRLDQNYPQGRLFLFYNTGDHHEGEVRKGVGLREVLYITSADGGQTWSPPVNITTSVHRPCQPAYSSDYQFPEDWRSYANTPGHAFQFSHGAYRGRIYVAANHSSGPPKDRFEDYASHAFYTDDHGRSFHLSETVGVPGSNEATAAPLSKGNVMMNMRNQKGQPRKRLVAVSKDGGAHWDEVYFDDQLPDPVCEGSLLELGLRRGRQQLAFCNAADTLRRNHLTLRISRDEGRTWIKVIPIDSREEAGSGDYTAYADLVAVNSRTIGVLYERNDYREIIFCAVKWKSSRP